MMDVEELITAMQEVKAAHPGIEYSDILRLFSIQATQKLTGAIDSLRINNGR